MSERTIGIVVLAAGASSRMGRAKQLLAFQGRTLVGRAVDVALGSCCRPVVVVTGAEAEAVSAGVAEPDVRVVLNDEWETGMGSSIRRGVAEIGEDVDAVVVMLCDQPFVTSQVVDRLVEAFRATRPLLVASEYETANGTVRGVPALFDRALFGELLALRGHEGARRVVERHAAEASFVRAPEAAVDVDTPEDYRALGEPT